MNDTPGGAAGGSVRVLVVDDEPDARDLVATLLEMAGMEVRVAGGSIEALEILETWVPEVVVSDIGMPDEDGFHLVRTVRASEDKTRRELPLIALTAFARQDDRKRTLAAGFDRHLGKPVEPAVLVATVLELASARNR